MHNLCFRSFSPPITHRNHPMSPHYNIDMDILITIYICYNYIFLFEIRGFSSLFRDRGNLWLTAFLI